MKKLKLFISIWFIMFSVAVFAQAEFEKIAITQNTLSNTATRILVQDATTGEIKYIAKSVLDNKENKSEKNVANGYAGLGSDGKLFSTQLPSITITDTFAVGSQAAMLALTAETGDVAVRTDQNKTYILKGTDPAVLANWQELLTPTSAVTSVFGRNGAVAAQNGDYTTALVTETTNKRYQTDIQQAYNDATSSIQSQLNAKEPSISAPGTVGSYWRGNKTFATLDTSVIPENGSLFFTNARARAAISLTTTGTSGAATYSSSTGVLNIPNYATGIGGIGTTNYIPKFTAASTLGNSQIFDNGTNVGIGTAVPNSTLDVNGSAYIRNDLRFGADFAGSNTAIFKWQGPLAIKPNSLGLFTWGDAKDIQIGGSNVIFGSEAGSERMRVTAGGSVGIGTPSPTDGKLQIVGNTQLGNTICQTYSGVAAYSQWITSGGAFAMGLDTAAGATERIRIAANGNVAIGTTTTANGNLTVKGGATSFELGTDASQVQLLSFDRGAGAYKNFSFRGLDFIFSPSDVEKMRLNNSGNLTVTGSVTATGFFQSSDLRLKDIVKRDGDVIYYKWKDARDAKLHIGYVAQEVQKENPEQVNTDDKGMLSVNYIEILVEKIRKLEKEIELLKAK